MPLDPRAIHIYADGSCLKNPGGRGGAAAFAVYPEHLGQESEQAVDSSFTATTNNRMELIACIKAIEWIRKSRPWPGVTRVQIVTDSAYVRENLTRARTWISNAGRNLHGEAKQNYDLWKELIRELSIVGMRVDFQWQLGKTSPMGKIVDKAAKVAAKRAGLYEDSGFKPGKISRSKVKGGVAKIFPANGQTAVIHVYRKTSPLNENQIRFHLFTEDSQSFVGSFYAYASDSLTIELQRGNLYRVAFNSNPHNPVIERIIDKVLKPDKES
jgi:ribonuclease HI